MRKGIIIISLLIIVSRLYGTEFTQRDRDRLIRVEAKIEQMEKRIVELREDMNKRFEQMMSFLWILTGIFVAITGITIGFAFWDRKTMVKRAKDEAIKGMKEDGTLRALIEALKEYAKENKKLAKILHEFRIL